MENVIHIKNAVLVALSGAGTVIANALGGWDAALKVLVCFMAADYITGLVVAGVFKRSSKSEGGALESRAGFKGLVRKCVVLLFVFLGDLLDKLLGADYIRTAVCMFFIANEGLSILENTALMGVPYPAFIKNMLEAMKDKSDSGETEKRA